MIKFENLKFFSKFKIEDLKKWYLVQIRDNKEAFHLEVEKKQLIWYSNWKSNYRIIWKIKTFPYKGKKEWNKDDKCFCFLDNIEKIYKKV